MTVCKNCGGDMVGDGYTTVFRCEQVEMDFYNMPEPDADPVYCQDGQQIQVLIKWC